MAAPSQHRANPGELISAGSALALLLLMFVLKWYGTDGIPGRLNQSHVTGAENAWHGLTVLRWLMLLTILVAIGSLVLHATQSAHGAKTDTSATVTALGTLTAILVCYRVLISLPAPNTVVDQKLGAILGVAAAIGIAVGGYESMREEQARSRGIEHRSRRGVSSRLRTR